MKDSLISCWLDCSGGSPLENVWPGVPLHGTYLPIGSLTVQRLLDQGPLASLSASKPRRVHEQLILSSAPTGSQPWPRHRVCHSNLPDGYILMTMVPCTAQAYLHYSPCVMRITRLIFCRDLLSLSLRHSGLDDSPPAG